MVDANDPLERVADDEKSSFFSIRFSFSLQDPVGNSSHKVMAYAMLRVLHSERMSGTHQTHHQMMRRGRYGGERERSSGTRRREDWLRVHVRRCL